ncbi:hypothetical protein JCM24511_06364 [Saitozyma sp. JCM 24511]|nr:hypothetical protein JCM24511_06364 [Saitozyma sp. JCM 24511]
MPAGYDPLPTSSDEPSSSSSSARLAAPNPDTIDSDAVAPSDPSDRPLRASIQAEFDRPPPSTFKRALLILTILLLGWASIRLGSWTTKKPEVIYASRYSDEFKYRPASSPVITEHLPDGRIRLRGASIGGVGVREEDVPKTPEQKRLEEKKRVDEAREKARERLRGSKAGSGKKVRGKKGRKVKPEI